MKDKSFNYIINSFLILSGILLLSYTAYRASVLSFTHDESISFNKYVHSSVWDIISYHVDPVIANNHILNTLFMKWQSAIFGTSEFSLRLHSWLAHIIYILFSYLILKETKSKVILLMGFILLNFNPYLLDFFSLARGYGLSISLMLMSLFYFIKYYNHRIIRYSYISLLLAILAALANFSLISYCIALIVVFELVYFQKKEKLSSIVKLNIPILLSLIALFLIYKGPIKILADNHQLTFESDGSIGFDTVISSVMCYLYSTKYYSDLFVFFRLLVTITAGGFIIVTFLQIKSKTITSFSYISFILCLILLFNLIQHQLFGSSYFRERFALFLVPLFFITFLNIVLFLINKSIVFSSIGYLSILSTIFCSLIIFTTSINLNYNSTWKYDTDTKKMISEIALKEKKKITIGISWIFEPAINFYITTKKIKNIEPVNRYGLQGDYDYYYVAEHEFESFNKLHKKFIKYFPKSGTVLFKNQSKK